MKKLKAIFNHSYISSYIIIILAVCFTSISNGQDYVNDNYLRYDNFNYDTLVKTVLCERNNVQLSSPVIVLGSNDQIKLSFDLLGSNHPTLNYRIVQCQHNWMPSTLINTEYIDGFSDGTIGDFRQSFNTTIDYVHYNLLLPNEQTQFKLSGNYLIVIYQNGNPDDIILSRRIWVVENLVGIKSTIHRATNPNFRNTHQEVDFSLQIEKIDVVNPYQDIHVKLIQNRNWQMAIDDLQPNYVYNNTIDYEQDEHNLFAGGNEFRNFDTRTVQFKTTYISNIQMDSSSGQFSIDLKNDIRKGVLHYMSENDINGNCLIKIYNDRNSDLESDYMKVRFTMPVLEEMVGGQLYLYGALTNWNIIPEGLMHFNPINSLYTNELEIKQGYYNYQYLWVKDSGAVVEIAETEGQHFETINEYEYFVYFRDIKLNTDRLVGYKNEDSLGF